jgi:UDP-glucuronate 4-epimerase
MRYLVTGAAGFIGFHVSARLLRDGHEVVGLDDLNDYYSPALKQARLAELAPNQRFRFEQLDVADELGLRLLMSRDRYDVVIHLAAQAGVRWSLDNPMAYIRSNVAGTTAVFEAARRTDVGHVVYASSSSVYGATSRVPFSVRQPADHPVSVYAASKRATELIAHTYSHLYALPTTGLRFFTVYGPWGRPDMAYYAFALAMTDGRPIDVFGDGSQLRDMTYVDDIVEGVVRVAQLPPEPDPAWRTEHADPSAAAAPYRVHNIGHGGQITLSHLIGLLERELGVEAIRNHQPSQPGDMTRTHADVGDLQARVGFLPTTPVEEGIARFVEWFHTYHIDLRDPPTRRELRERTDIVR